MKTFKKVLASTLAAAMVVTALPVTPANAAAAPKLSATKATLYVGQSKAITVKAIPSTWKSAKVTATSSKKSVATVKTSKKKVTVKAVKAGTAKVTVKVTGKKSGKAVKKTLKATITVKNPALTLKAANEVAVGATEQITATVKPANTKVAFTSSDDTIAKVDEKGVVTGVKAGEVTITAKAGKTTKTVKMTVKKYVFESVKQTRYNQIEASVKGDIASLKAADFNIWNNYSTNVHPVKTVSVNKKNSTVLLTTYYEGMTDAKTYNVVLDGTTKQFVASDGKVDHIGVVPTEITVATETPIKAAFYDVHGVVVKNEQLYNGGTRLNNLDFNITTSQGYTTANGMLHLYEVGNTATATLELHSNTFDANGNEVGNIKNTATITAVAAATITDQSFSTKIGNAGSSYDAVKETVVAQGDSSKSAYIRIKLSDGTTSDNLSAYKLESSDLNVLILNSAAGPNNGEVALKPVLPGSCYIIVRDAKNNVVATLPITVKAARYAASLSLSKYTATLSNKVYDVATSAFIADTATATATVLDQYGEDMHKAAGFAYNRKTLNGNNDTTSSVGSVSGATITLTAAPATSNTTVNTTKGTYVGVVTYSDGTTTLSKTVSTTVQEPGDQVDSYQLVLDKTDVDAVITNTTTTDTTVNADVIGYDGGIKRKIYTDAVASSDWKLAAGNVPVTKDATDASISKKISINDVSEGVRMPAKTYALTATFTCGADDVNPNVVKTITRNFTVKDTQHVPTVTLANDGKINASITAADIMTAYYYSIGDGNTCTITGIRTNDSSVDNLTTLLNNVKAGTSYMVYDVNVDTTLSNGNHVKSTVKLNHTVSKDGNW